MTLTSPRFGALTLLAALSAGALLTAQSQAPPVFRAEASLVEVIVRVTDSEGQFIPNLTQADFALEEEGRVQTIVAFNRVDLSRPPTPELAVAGPVLDAPVMSTVATNEKADDARIFVVLMDDIQTAPQFSMPARRAARAFIERHVGPDDLVAVFSTGGFGARTQEFTTDKTRVLQAIDRFMGQRCRFKPGVLKIPPESDAERVYKIRVATDVIRALADHLSGIRGRRVSLLWIAEGVDYNLIPPISGAVRPESGGDGDSGTVIWAMNEAVHTLRKANVTLYAVDPRHLYAEDNADNNPLCRDPDRVEFQRSLDVLQRFSDDTGGFAAVQANDYTPQFDRILDENSQYYVLGYQPNRRGRDGEVRRIRVRVVRPGLERSIVSSRASYTVSSPRPPEPGPPGLGPALSEAITSSIPAAGLPLRVQAVPRRGTDGRGLVYVIVEAAGTDLQFIEKDGRFIERIEFGLLTADRLARQGNLQPVAMDLSLDGSQVPQVRRSGVRWLTTIDLEPGHYDLRVAGHAVHSNRTGATFLDIDVPKYEDNELRIDGLVLTSLPAALGVTSGASPIGLSLPGPPTTTRTFVKGDVITLGAEIGVRRDFTRGAVELTVHEQSASREAPPVLTRAVTLADRATAEQPRVFAIDTAVLGAGQFVLRMAVGDQENRHAETAVLFEVIEQQVRQPSSTIP